MKKSIIYIMILFFTLLSCKSKNFEKVGQTTVNKLTDFNNIIIADTIIYDVIIKMTDTNDYWTKECLKYVKIDTFINYIFDKIYEKKFIAYDIFTNKPLSIKDLKKLEKEKDFNRKNIAKMQFTEKWYFDKETGIFNKKILSISFGYEVKDKLGNIRGYKPLFKIKFE